MHLKFKTLLLFVKKYLQSGKSVDPVPGFGTQLITASIRKTTTILEPKTDFITYYQLFKSKLKVCSEIQLSSL